MHFNRVGRLVAAGMLCVALTGAGFVQRASASAGTYVVQPNDTLSSIAATLGTTVAALMAANNLKNADLIVPGQILVIGTSAPAATALSSSYQVRPGDTLSGIAAQAGVSLAALASANGLTSPYTIVAGQSLAIPGGSQVAGSGIVTATATNSLYTVKPGDTLSSIATSNGVSIDALAVANNLASPFLIGVGQKLLIPGSSGGSSASTLTQATSTSPSSIYVVQPGDTLSTIAARLQTTVDALIAANNLADPGMLSVGQQITLPAGVAGGTVDQATVAEILTTQAQAAGLDVGLLKAVAWQESGWQMVTAADGGIGVMQLMPDSVDWVSNVLLGQSINPYNVTDNIRAGAAMLHYYLGVFGDEQHALAAYHQGMASVQAVGITPDTQAYIDNVLALQQQFGG